jgi:lipid-A-disaccharide synthase-like uncharacterized protein
MVFGAIAVAFVFLVTMLSAVKVAPVVFWVVSVLGAVEVAVMPVLVLVVVLVSGVASAVVVVVVVLLGHFSWRCGRRGRVCWESSC